MLNVIAAASRIVSRLALWFSGAGLIAMTGVIFWQVIARYGFNASPAWAEQVALVLMIWIVFFAAAAGVREGFHIRITAGVDVAPASIQKPLKITAHLVVAAFGLALAVWGGELVLKTWGHIMPAIGISRGLAYAPAPISGVLMVLFALEQAVATMMNRKVAATWS